MSHKWIIVDDSDPRIRYTGQGWTPAGDTGLNQNGPIYNRTVHGARSNDSFVFSFKGTSVRVWGSINLYGYPSTSGGLLQILTPLCGCFVDQSGSSPVGTNSSLSSPGNNFLLCDIQSLTDGPHELTTNVTFSSDPANGPSLWIDYIEYVPSSSVSEETAYILVKDDDPDIVYDSGWLPMTDNASAIPTRNWTSSVIGGVELMFNFTGKGLTWVGVLSDPNTATSSYSIDGGTPVTFDITGVPITSFNQILFSTPALPAGPHSLRVVHGINTASLALDHFIVTNSSLTSAPKSSSSLLGPLPTTSLLPTSSSHRVPIGTVVGGVVGGVVLVFLSLVLIFIWRRRRGRDVQMSDGLGAQLKVSPLMRSYRSPSAAGIQTDGTPYSRDSQISTLAPSLPSPELHLDSSASTSSRNSGGTESTTRAIGMQAAKLVRLEYVRQAVAHEDSGVRFHQTVDEVPPGYTAN